MKLDIKSVQLHGTLFLGGKNFKEKVDIHSIPGLKLTLTFLEEKVLVLVLQWKEFSTIIQSFSHAEPKNIKDIGFESLVKAKTKEIPVVQVSHPMKTGVATSAQVSTPTDHVFKGR
jgi:hypothetical protein